ncbi:MAG: hypothetical protein WEE64_02685 [Dehalococcoidia bacterium]
MSRIAVAAFGLALMASLVLAWQAPDAAADALLSATTAVTYDVRPDDGGTRVTWQVDLRNNDPQTVYRDQGYIYFYDRYPLPVLRGATGLTASGPGGGLSVTTQDAGEGPVVSAIVRFDRNLHYGQSYSFSLSYSLTSARSESLLVTPHYVFVPAVTTGDASTVRVTTPDDDAWDVTVEAADCPETGTGEYQCEATDMAVAAAIVEVAQPALLESIETSVAMPSATLPVTIRYFPGEQDWADHMQELTTAALPVLAELFGSPAEDASRVEIAERGQRDILGYEGVASCLAGSCRIGVSPIADDFVALHELAHLWTTPFDSRWLAEGLADFMADRTADRLGALVSRDERLPPERLIDLALHDWGGIRRLVGATEEERIREQSAYLESLRMFETLEERVGLAAIQEANRSAFAREEHSVDSRYYLDFLEEAGGAPLDDLFLAEVFPPSFASQLEDRREAHTRLAFITTAAENVGLRVPDSIQKDVDDWAFGSAFDRLDGAQDALGAYAEAQDKVAASRDLWQRFGLLGEDPEGALEEAAAAFGGGAFAESGHQAERAGSMIDDAGQSALVRLLMVLAVWGGVVALFAVAFFGWRRFRGRRHQAESSAG